MLRICFLNANLTFFISAIRPAVKHERRKTNRDGLPVVNIETKTSLAAAMHTNRDLVFIPGQRGKNLLLYQNYTYSKNNGTGNTTYWKCRIIKNGKPCNARITTFLRPNGLYNVCLTKPEHIHPPSTRLFKKNNLETTSARIFH